MDIEGKKAHIFGSMFVLANKLQTLGDRLDPKLTVKQWLFIAAVNQFSAAPTITEIADHIGYSRQNAKRIASSLAAQGFVDMQVDVQDRRAQRIRLTDACHQYFSTRQRGETEFIESLFADLTESDISGLYAALDKLEINISAMEVAHESSKED